MTFPAVNFFLRLRSSIKSKHKSWSLDVAFPRLPVLFHNNVKMTWKCLHLPRHSDDKKGGKRIARVAVLSLILFCLPNPTCKNVSSSRGLDVSASALNRCENKKRIMSEELNINAERYQAILYKEKRFWKFTEAKRSKLTRKTRNYVRFMQISTVVSGDSHLGVTLRKMSGMSPWSASQWRRFWRF